jgi:hypothetical protein
VDLVGSPVNGVVVGPDGTAYHHGSELTMHVITIADTTSADPITL